MNDQFYRMKRMPPYVIAEVNAMRHAARLAGQDIIDLGMGNPDQPPPQHVIDKLCEVAAKPDAHGYSQSKGIPGLRRAQAGYYARRFGVELDPDSEVVVTMGSKEGLSSLATAIIAPGDVVLAPNPSYPIHTFGFIIAGATIRSVPTTPDENYWRSLERAMAYTVPRPSILIVNYPSNPTAQVVDLDFYTKLVDFAREAGLIVISDLAYAEVYFDDANPPPSVLQVPGAIDINAIATLEQGLHQPGSRVTSVQDQHIAAAQPIDVDIDGDGQTDLRATLAPAPRCGACTAPAPRRRRPMASRPIPRSTRTCPSPSNSSRSSARRVTN